ncbi:MAG: hypothetical protein AAF700_08520 [Pseudomonadota bacterium]
MYRFALFAATLAGLAACEAPSSGTADAASAPSRIATDADFARIADKKLVLNDDVFFILRSDGVLTGETPTGPVIGTHEMRDGFWCRTLTQGAPNAPRKECQVLELDGDQLTGTRDRGRGSSYTLTVT